MSEEKYTVGLLGAEFVNIGMMESARLDEIERRILAIESFLVMDTP